MNIRIGAIRAAEYSVYNARTVEAAAAAAKTAGDLRGKESVRSQQEYLRQAPRPLPDPPPDLKYLRSTVADALNRVALNPQPLPPRFYADPPPYLKNILSRAAAGFERVALNPQPLPPGPDPGPDRLKNILSRIAGVFDRVAFNPQPEPPGPDPAPYQKNIFSKVRSNFDLVALNPQPLPPGPDPARFVNFSLRRVVG
jgi:hypothetical protein